MKNIFCLFIGIFIIAGCRSRLQTNANLVAAEEAGNDGLVKVSSTFKSDDGQENLHLTGYGFLVKVPGTIFTAPTFFVVTASHLSQGGVSQVEGHENDQSILDAIDLKIEAKIDGQVVPLQPINRLASIRRDIEIIHIKSVKGLEPLAVVTKDTRLPVEFRRANPYGWLEVVHPAVIKNMTEESLNAGHLYPLGLLTTVPQSSFVREVIESPVSKFKAAELQSIIDKSTDPWRRQMLRLGYETVLDEIETYNKLPAGFSGAPILFKIGDINTVLGLVTSYSRAFNLSWGLPSHFITRTINLYMTRLLGQPASKIGVLANSESWKLHRGLIYRKSAYLPSEFGGSSFSEITLANLPAGNGSSSPGGNGSSSPGGKGSSSPGGKGSSSPGGNGSSSPGGDGDYNFDVDPMIEFGIQYGLDFSSPTITGNAVEHVLGFKLDLQFQGKRSQILVDANMSALNSVLNSLSPDYSQNPANPELKVIAISDYGQWCRAVQDHLLASGFKQAGLSFTSEAKIISKNPEAKTEVQTLVLKVQFRNDAMTQFVIESQIEGVTYTSEVIDGREKLRPFIKQTSTAGRFIYVTLAGIVMQDTSVQSPLDKLVQLPVAQMEWLFPKLKFTLLRDGEDFLGIIPTSL